MLPIGIYVGMWAYVGKYYGWPLAGLFFLSSLDYVMLCYTEMGGCHMHTARAYSPHIQKAIEGVQFIAQHIKDADKDNEVGQHFLETLQ